MRKYLLGFLALALSVGVAGAAFGGAEFEQTITGPAFKPNKLNKKKYKKGELTVRTTLEGVESGGPIPQKANNVLVDFSKNIALDPDAVPACTEDLENTTRETAIERCGDAQVSIDGDVASGEGSFATAALATGPGGTAGLVDVDVIAFNGGASAAGANAKASATTGTFILWTRVLDLITTILPATLEKAPKPFGTRLNVIVPPLAGGTGALSDFQTQVKAGKYIQGRCKNDKKKMAIEGTFHYDDAPDAVVSDSSKIKKCNKKT